MNVAALATKGRLAVGLLASNGFPWHLSDGQSSRDAHRLRSLARRLSVAKWPLLLRPFAMLGALVVWPVASYREAKLLHTFSNPDAAPKDLQTKAWRAALRHNIPAAEYGAFGLWRADAMPPDSWLYTRECSLLSGHLTNPNVSDLVGDKVEFAEFCTQKGSLPVVETLAVFRRGVAVVDFENALAPERSLISKPVRTSMGRGFEHWTFKDGAFTASTRAHPSQIARTKLSETLAAVSLRHHSGLVVQPFVSAHASIANLSEQGPAVARIITGRWQNGCVEVLNSMLQKPNNGGYRTHGGPFCLIDTATGKAIARTPDPHLFPTATDDSSFDGICLPDWNKCTSALINLHTATKGQAPLLGWDIIFAPDGPTILEANTTLAPYFFQLASQQPASNGKWISLLAGYLP